jgi:phospho-N-acetylmuramoyl-pentapeptide-transferase
MFHSIASYLSIYWGPFRLLGSFLFLMIVGAASASAITWYILPRYWHILPTDKGRENTPEKEVAKGKPTGAGFLVVLILVPLWILFVPVSLKYYEIFGCLVLAMLSGYGDDRSHSSWSELLKGSCDFVVAAFATLAICQGQDMTIWLPLHKGVILVPFPLYMAAGTALLWITINATNCSDGVDGLAGTLTLLSLFYLGSFLYLVVGHARLAAYFLVPHNPEGAMWAVLLFIVAGAVAGYLWHNAQPSNVLMGDAGSRFFGLLVGMAVLASGNPLLILVVAPVVLVNGGTGLVKVALLRIFRRFGFDISQKNNMAVEEAGAEGTNGNGKKDKNRESGPHAIIRVLHKVRFPLHDHCRKNLKWSNAQVLMRFVLLQAFLTPLLLGFFIKVR